MLGCSVRRCHIHILDLMGSLIVINDIIYDVIGMALH
jgi:hypothetical protein